MTQQRSGYPSDYAKGSGESAQDRVREMADKAGEKLKDAGANAQELAGNIAEQAREYSEKAQQAAQEFKPFVEKSLKEQPMSTLAAAAAIGFVLGAIWKK
jgi:ElaB/YqjD/DUF883 family membrane-anchored ribosome-binding protein